MKNSDPRFSRACLLILIHLLCGTLAGTAQQLPAGTNAADTGPSNAYPLGPDSLPQNVPHGKVFQFPLNRSRIFPNTSRTISVYVPAQYTGEEDACVYVGLDGLGFNAPVVFDNLIAKHAMPVAIAIGVAPGSVASTIAKADPRFDRSFEFDSMTGRLADFLLTEVLPQVAARTTPDGKPIRLSSKPDDRAIGGSSTGAIAAFNVAWQRPEAFHRVFSSIGTYVGMRGGEGFYVLVRKSEPKPIRVFLEDGAYDQWPGGPEMGDWWMSNQTMERALTFAGYDVRHNWGLGTHNGAHAAAIFPEAMQWLWRDWPRPVAAMQPGNPALQPILSSGQSWQMALDHCPAAAHLAGDAGGRVFFLTSEPDEVIPGTHPAACPNATGGVFAYGATGAQYQVRGESLYRSEPGAGRTVGGKAIARSLPVRAFAVLPSGDVYATVSSKEGDGEVWLLHKDGTRVRVASGLVEPSAIALTPDKAWLLVTQRNSRYGYSYRILPDGSLDSGEPFLDFFVPAGSEGSQAASIAMDAEGRAYVATAAGVEIFDHNGRVTGILALPGNRAATSLCFGGKDLHTLYVSDGEHVFTRVLKVKGAPDWAPASAVPDWGAG